MKVFVSWSGDPSKAVASALKNWLRKLFPTLEVWMSEQDIQAGTKWGIELGKALGECKLGIICLTPESLHSRWLAFEAGALSAAIDGSRVIPYRFQLRTADISPPLSQFQDVGADQEGTYRLVQSINDALGKELYREQAEVREIFDMWWPKLDEALEKVQSVKPSQIRTDRELLEEILDLARKESIRGLDAVLRHLFAIPNVRRVEVAAKEVAGAMTSRVALRITVAKKLPLTEIRPEELIPASIFGMPTDVVESA
jgi:TIR domain